ncbi:hypothetical protein M378DRAFT_19074 [Amanita muscaria Koide BX008]|uniref:Uncharacterized protein n=1 Tax=Amanita muscaria (strain Koide BX008) TaxID=946122 RepID=A0A0C2VZI6_AMAMK|nr:hypothetical protein M378DRAFT_19074 [Amanita muscaria Koide BX008]
MADLTNSQLNSETSSRTTLVVNKRNQTTDSHNVGLSASIIIAAFSPSPPTPLEAGAAYLAMNQSYHSEFVQCVSPTFGSSHAITTTLNINRRKQLFAKRKRGHIEELKLSEQEVSRRILKFIVTDNDEEQHDVRWKQCVLSLSQSLSETIAGEVRISQSPANTIHLQSPLREYDGVPTPTTRLSTRQSLWPTLRQSMG